MLIKKILMKNIRIILLFSMIVFLTCSFSFAESSTDTQKNTISDQSNLNSANFVNDSGEVSLIANNKESMNKSKEITQTKYKTAQITGPKTLSQSKILISAKYVKTYTEKYGKLPDYVTISNYNYSMPEFMYLLSKTINYKYKNIKTDILAKYGIKDPISPTGNSINKKITKKAYYSLATNIFSYIDKYNTAPKYASSSFGKVQYQTAIYGFSRILAYTYSYNSLPSYLSLNIKNTNSINKKMPKYTQTNPNIQNNSGNNSENVKPTKLSQNSILVASSSIKSYVEKNGKLPNYVTISNYKYSIPEYLYLISKLISSKYGGSNGDIMVKYGIKNPSSPSGASINKIFTKTEYYDISKRISTFIENNKQSPNYVSSKYGNIQYQTIIYGLVKVGDYINKNKVLPNSLSLNVPISSSINKYLPIFNQSGNLNNSSVSSKLLGSNDLGTVEIIGAFGNIKSDAKVAFVIGLTPLEASIKKALYDSIVSQNVQDYCYYIYMINVTKASSSYDEEKIYAEALANEFAQPHITNSNYNLVVNIPEE